MRWEPAPAELEPAGAVWEGEEESCREERNPGQDGEHAEGSSHLRVCDITKSSEVWITGAKCQQLHLHRAAAVGLVCLEMQLYALSQRWQISTRGGSDTLAQNIYISPNTSAIYAYDRQTCVRTGFFFSPQKTQGNVFPSKKHTHTHTVCTV